MRLNNTIIIILLVTFLVYLFAKQTEAVQGDAIKAESERFLGSLVFDKKDVPYYNYSYTGHHSLGVQGNPHAVITHALQLYKQYFTNANESAKQYFINNVDWLVNTNMLKDDGSFSVYEYPFSWKIGNLTIDPHWRNGMVGGEALNPLGKAYRLTGNMTYLDTAKKILNSFYVDVKDGGVAYKTPSSGWWYEEYASRNSTNEPKVLNGMIHALIGINEYRKVTNDTSAKFVFDQGILALKNDLPKYDNNGASFYDRLGLPANSFYKSLHVVQLNQLYEITNEPVFKIYHDKWNSYNIINKS